LRIDVDSELSKIGDLAPRLVGCECATVYLPIGPSPFGHYSLQVQLCDGWWPEYEFNCATLFEHGTGAYSSDKRRVIGIGHREVVSKFSPESLEFRAGVYRVILFYATDDPSSGAVACKRLESPAFTVKEASEIGVSYHRW
jgi:hypothetical protein